MPTWLPITFKMCAYSWGPRVWGDAPLHRGSRAASLTLVLDEHISPWKSAWRGAPGRPRVPWLPARFPSQGAPAPAAAHQASRTPGWAPIWGWSAACGWPGAGAGTVSWAPPPTTATAAGSEASARYLPAHVRRVPVEPGEECRSSFFFS